MVKPRGFVTSQGFHQMLRTSGIIFKFFYILAPHDKEAKSERADQSGYIYPSTFLVRVMP